MLRIGEIIDDKYKIISIVGKGGMGTVYKAVNIKLGNYWAVKELKNKENLEQEVLILRSLKHQGLPLIIDAFQIVDNWYLIEEYVEGISLDNVIERKKQIKENVLLEWAIQICNILNYLHMHKPKPIIYQDLKPSNLIINEEGIIKLVDFGISSLYDETIEKSGLGTKGYAAPEQYISSTSKIDNRTDIYGLGATLYHLSTGKKLNQRDSNSMSFEDTPNLSQGFKYIIEKCTKLQPDERYKNIIDVINDFQNIHLLNNKLNRSSKKVLFRNAVIGIILFGLLNGIIYAVFDIRRSKYDDYLSLINQAVCCYEDGSLLTCEELLKKAITEQPKKKEAYKKLLEIYLDQGRYTESLDMINELQTEKLIQLNEDFYYIEGRAYFYLGDFSKAISLYRKSLDLNPNLTDINIDMCIALARSGALDEARDILKNIDGKIDNSLISYLNAEILISMGDYSSAIEYLEKSLDSANYDERQYKLMAYTYRKMGDYDKEILVLQQASNKYSNISILELLGDAYQRKGDILEDNYDCLEKALDCYKKYIENGFETPSIYVKMGRVLRKQKQYLEAEKCLDRALELDDKYSNAYIQMGYLYIEKENAKETRSKNYDSALEYLRTGIALKPNSAESLQAKENLKLIEEGDN